MMEEMETSTEIRNPNVVHQESMSTLDRFALWVTQHVGSTGFFLLIMAWTLVWLLWNTAGPREYRFDSVPAFELWLFISNIIQILLLPLILVGQNLQQRHSELRAETDFAVNVKAEQEVALLMEHLKRQDVLLRQLEEKLDKK